MDKYKLIKMYPGSPKLGTIVDENSPHNLYRLCIGETEFWEKVKDYEILELSFKRSERPEIRSVIGYSKDYLEALIKCENTIHSVKRLSDNVIFTVGDKVIEGTVKNIIIEKNKIYLEI
jgi:hypothetical protein